MEKRPGRSGKDPRPPRAPVAVYRAAPCPGKGRGADGPRRERRKSRGPHHRVRAPALERARRQAGTMFSACGPFWPWVTSKVTFWPSWSSRKPFERGSVRDRTARPPSRRDDYPVRKKHRKQESAPTARDAGGGTCKSLGTTTATEIDSSTGRATAGGELFGLRRGAAEISRGDGFFLFRREQIFASAGWSTPARGGRSSTAPGWVPPGLFGQEPAGRSEPAPERRSSSLIRRASSSWSSRITMRQAASIGLPASTSSRARAAMRSW